MHKYAPQDSFDSTSFPPTEAADDTSVYTNPNNSTLASEDRSLNVLTPRKAHSMRGRSHVLAPGSDLRKAKMSHSWHNLRHKRFLKQSVSTLERRRSSERKKKSNGADVFQLSEESIPLSDVSSELYQNPAGTDPIQPVIENITPISSDASTNLREVYTTEAPTPGEETIVWVTELTAELYQNPVETGPVEQSPIETTPTEQVIIETTPTEETLIPVTLADPSQPVSKPHTARTPAPGPIQDHTPPSLSEIYNTIPVYGAEEYPSSTEEYAQEATISTFVQPTINRSVARPSLDLSEGHVIGIALGLETGHLPLEENRPHSFHHDRSFTGLPEEENLDARRSIFQSPGELDTIDSEIQTPGNPPTSPTDNENKID